MKLSYALIALLLAASASAHAMSRSGCYVISPSPVPPSVTDSDAPRVCIRLHGSELADFAFLEDSASTWGCVPGVDVDLKGSEDTVVQALYAFADFSLLALGDSSEGSLKIWLSSETASTRSQETLYYYPAYQVGLINTAMESCKGDGDRSRLNPKNWIH